MKRPILLTLAFAALGLWVNWSCSNSSSSPNGFQSPVLTVVSINPPFTATPIPTDTPTPTATATSTFTPTATPYAVSTWTGFNAPSAIAVDSNHRVYVADTGNNFVERFDSNGILDISWGAGGLKGKVAYPSPKGIAVDGNGDLYVVGSGNQVSRYRPVTTGSSTLIQDASYDAGVFFSGSLGVATDSSVTFIAVADTGNDQVVLLDKSSGASMIGYPISSPAGVAVDGVGNIFASTGTGNTVVKLYSTTATIPGFSNPQGIFTDGSDDLWVADKGNKQVEAFRSTGLDQEPFLHFNGSGVLTAPAGVAVDLNGTIYVVDQGANKVVKFAP
ncbi:MAG TPA: NHL repeat-containing protein [bacterium]|nr:NHL repeat-containing protein [bacterium]